VGSKKYALDNFGGAVPLPDSLLFPAGFSSTNSNFEFFVQGVGEFFKGKNPTDEQRQVNLVDNLSVTTGSHQLKFGADYRRLSPFTSPWAYFQFAQFSGMTTAPGGALSGRALSAESEAAQSDALLSQNYSFYGQDTWKITPRLTATYGLRWDINPPLRGTNLANDPFAVAGLNDPATMTLAPRGTPLYKTTYGNVAPRLGLAYQVRRTPNWSASYGEALGSFTILDPVNSEQYLASFRTTTSRSSRMHRFR
jgi:outer membrane receptor protein involved in Fe transport